MTQAEFDKATLAEQILYDCTGMLGENHPTIIEAMDKHANEKVKNERDYDCLNCGVSYNTFKKITRRK